MLAGQTLGSQCAVPDVICAASSLTPAVPALKHWLRTQVRLVTRWTTLTILMLTERASEEPRYIRSKAC